MAVREPVGAATDAELVRAVREGDKQSFAVLVSRHRTMASRLVARMVRADGDVEDVLQETTVAALIGLDRLRSPDRFGAWYAGIALNVSRRMLRQQARSGSAAHFGPTSVAGVDEQVEAAEIARLVRHAVGGLAAGQRAAVLAFYWRGLTHSEAAAELQISTGAVKARLHAARAALSPRLATFRETEVVYVDSLDQARWVTVDVVEVRRAADGAGWSQRHAAVLRERDGERTLAIWMGAPEAVALACSLESYETPRPMTYQFTAGLLEASRARVREVHITRLAEATYYALVSVDGPAGTREVDARPSDALNLALVAGAPILIEESLLDDPGVGRHKEWLQYPTSSVELVAELDERRRRDWEKLRATFERETNAEEDPA